MVEPFIFKTNTLMKISMNNGNKVKYEINRLRPNTSPILDGIIDNNIRLV